MPMIWLATSFLVRQPGGYGEMALYSAANNLRIMVLFLPNVMNSVGLSVLNNEKAKGGIQHFNRIFKSNVVYVFLISLGGVLAVGVCGRWILQLFGKDFGDAHFLLWILLLCGFFESLSIVMYQYVQSKEKLWISFFSINIPREAFFVLTAYYLVQSHGGVGLAAAYLVSTIFGLAINVFLIVLLHNNEIREMVPFIRTVE
jgi:O-antigen/teichoic acid export membrane protein